MATEQSRIRNFCIIAHIDHGKSTLADRLLELTGTLSKRELQEQVLDSMDLERERGITIKSHAIRMDYTSDDGTEYVLNLIDTPGHVDFTYEVSRALEACEGAILVVDAAQGIEAQTISNLLLAMELDLEIIPVLNKVDLPGANPEAVASTIENLIGEPAENIARISAKTGEGVHELLETIVERIPEPSGNIEAPLKALIFDSIFNTYRGSIVYARVFDGQLNAREGIRFMSTGKECDAEEIGFLRMNMEPVKNLSAGEVGYIIGSIKDVKETQVGDTITTREKGAEEAISGFREAKPMVFSGVYPTNAEEFEDLRASLEKLQLNDAALTFEPETSVALGFGFRVGFLGLLHMEIVQERLDREFGLDIITTVPNVKYRVNKNDDAWVNVENPSNMPPVGDIQEIHEPIVKAEIITPTEYIGGLMQLCQDRRGVYINTQYLDEERVSLEYHLPLAEIVFDYYDKLKSISRGYASLDYDYLDYRTSHLVKLDVMINGDAVDALSTIVHRDKAYEMGRKLVKKLRELIPRQMFDVALQAAVGSRIISRETVKALRKDVTAKCYGGDISRKRKLLEKQKKGKKRMKQVGSVEVPQEAFLAVLSMDD
ncbi:MAG: elongation factor 4 [Bacteroidetes Order II. Incertae sedis bacterium]|jgi:GTP-binding protein LepA|nr:elongation factor 4 [Bacteroidetes Order II. bacterium]MBT4053023.1 elongation factor 4 [Bacteroidetes Order II. bacterium]MBT4601790.1 elongation factor 4 [Bacteroidetes Order II. bacterium]MBT5250985.1 elongation factor 4 [Bacteroidetes Order II. bacterium]MBT6201348.1 elongation factor 4 [Bacteroidetes Order II. bacterium]